ncbi:hypothetical protein SAMN05216466_107146 [Paraburkholderia phenazinium]|uniref:Uncharacterized protein n=1 Tax=Paraburkholderia phenazinium TaxID=60549 RepID=A0A1G7ZRM7_9BURK|nr:hypothetical protein [Paraburkholderia phenazinium]SDH11338.1 hypothetical protein SAMN05216466_107146 [Paraburkholderia phenazinium]
MNKEQIYDEQISPLMTQIIAICRAHKIAHVACFAIPTEDDPDLRCSTAQLTSDFEPPEEFLQAWKHLRPASRSSTMMLRTESGDGNVTLTTIVE